VAFALSAGLFGVLALPFLVLRWSLDAYLLVCGGVLALSLVGALLLALRGRPAPEEPATEARGTRLLWVPLAGMAAALAVTAVHVFQAPNTDIWSLIGFVQGFSDVDQPRSAWGRYALNGWIFEQAALVRVTGLDALSLVQDYLAPIMVVITLLAFYWLALILFKNRTAALLATCVATLGYLLQIDAVQAFMGNELIARSTEDKHVTRFVFMPVALGITALYARTRDWRYLALFTVICWTVVTVHPMGLLLIGISVTGFALVHLILNLRDRGVWWVVGALGAAMASIGLPPAIYLFATGNSYVSQMDGTDPGMASFLLSWAQKREQLMVLGDGWHIMHPSFLLDPMILAALVLGVPFLIWRSKKYVAAQLLLGVLLFTAFLIYFPPVSTFIGGFTGPWSLWRLAWPIQLASPLIIGWMVWELVAFAMSRLSSTRLSGISTYTPLLLVIVLIAVAAPSALAGLRSADDEGETTQQESNCLDPTFRWLGERVDTPATMVLASDGENGCFPAYSSRIGYVSFRGIQFGNGPNVPQSVADVRKFFEATALDGEMIEILNRYEVDLILLPADSPLNEQMEHLPGFEALDNPGSRYQVYDVNREELETGPVTEMNGFLNDGEYERALEEYGAALDGGEDEQFLAYLASGLVYTEMEIPAFAESSYEQALRLFPNSPQVYSLLADTYTAQDDLQSAVGVLERAVDQAPREVDLRFDLGDLLLELGDDDEALEHYRKVVETFPKVPEYRIELGSALLRAEEQGAAREEFQRAARLDPLSPEIYQDIAEANKEAGQFKAAAASYQETLRLDPGNQWFIVLQMGRAYYNLADPDKKDDKYFELAEEHLRMAAEPQDGKAQDGQSKQLRGIAYLTLGNLYRKWDKPEKATTAYEQALEVNPDLKQARNKLEKLNEKS
jgi:tetratricopeptide (TPR) repeat protein